MSKNNKIDGFSHKIEYCLASVFDPSFQLVFDDRARKNFIIKHFKY